MASLITIGHALLLLSLWVPSSASARVAARGSTPRYNTDANTTPYCSWWWDNDGSVSCQDTPGVWGISLADFLRWNPSILPNCGNYNVIQSYCVEAVDEPPVNTPAPTSSPPASTTTSPGNGIATPTPTQPHMVSNCNKFAFVKSDDSCAGVAKANGVSVEDFALWNPDSGATSNCQGLWANAYACVGVIGAAPTRTPSATPTTSAGNGIATPTPTQPHMVANCNKFAFVRADDTCAGLAAANGVSVADFSRWNPDSGATSTCQGLWANAYACVGVVGFTATPTKTAVTTTTTTTRGNGVATPTPTQTGMVTNCNRFVFVKLDETCDSVARSAGITTANFIRWNPAVGADCRGLWSNTYACVGTF